MSLRDYIGIPYEIRGTPPRGADCYSLVRHYAEHERQIELPPYMYEVKDAYMCAASFMAEADKQMGTLWHHTEKKIDSVVVFRMMGLVMHCGIMVSEFEFLHAFKGRNSTVENIEDFYWQKRVEGFFRYG